MAFIPYYSGYCTPNISSNYESPIEELWLGNSLKKWRLEEEVRVLEVAISILERDGTGFKNPLSYPECIYFESRTPFGYFMLAGPRYDNNNWERVLVAERYLELKRLELKNHSLNMRRVLMDRKDEVASAYNKLHELKKELVINGEGKVALLMGRERNKWDTIFEMRKGVYRKAFYLGRILTNPLNKYSERTDAENYINPLFGDLICVRKNVALKSNFSKTVLNDPGNAFWFKQIYWEEKFLDKEGKEIDRAIDSKILKEGYIDPLKRQFEKEDNFQKFVKERAEMVDKSLMPTKRD
jgi:hypothetical protein